MCNSTRQDIFQNHLSTLTAGGSSSKMDPGPQLRLRLKIQVKCFYCWFMKNIYFTGCHRKHHTKLEKLDTKLGVFKETVSNSICICVFVFVPAVKRLFWAILDQHCLFTGTPVAKNTSVNYPPLSLGLLLLKENLTVFYVDIN